MGLYDRDYMKERHKTTNKSNFNPKDYWIIWIILAFILGFIIGKIL